MSLALAILPILLTLVAGYLVAATGLLPRDRWDGINALNFRVLIPAMLILSISASDLSSIASGAWIGAMLGTLALAAGAVLALRLVFSHDALPNPAFTTLFQSTTRWNAFIALAAAEQFIGAAGIALLALGMALMIPIINVINIVVLTLFGRAQASLGDVVRSILRNPLIVGCAVGLLVNFAGVPLPEFLRISLDLVSRAALGTGLLAVGAGIVLTRLLRLSWQVMLGIVLRLGLCPALFILIAYALGLTRQEALAGTLMYSVPAAVNGYVIARQMGGDADLFADVVTWQTLLCLGLLPVMAWFVLALF